MTKGFENIGIQAFSFIVLLDYPTINNLVEEIII